MDLVRVGASFRAIRVARRERISDVAARTGLARSVISRIERGDGHQSAISVYERLAAALAASTDLRIQWHGAELDRLLNAAHSSMHDEIAKVFASHEEWRAIPEVSFSVYGERGVIDWLAWHGPTRSLLVVEIKTALVDVQALLGALDRYGRLAPIVARERGWSPVSVSRWLVFEDSSRNRRAIAQHRTLFERVYPADGRIVRAWLSQPRGSICALSFLANSRRAVLRPRRVRRPTIG
jgi:transcriptional regulator with XRE-family HTH domain